MTGPDREAAESEVEEGEEHSRCWPAMRALCQLNGLIGVLVPHTTRLALTWG
jgi:hypothetical protein